MTASIFGKLWNRSKRKHPTSQLSRKTESILSSWKSEASRWGIDNVGDAHQSFKRKLSVAIVKWAPVVTRYLLLVIIRPWLQPRSFNMCIEDYWNKILLCKGSSWLKHEMRKKFVVNFECINTGQMTYNCFYKCQGLMTIISTNEVDLTVVI